MPCFEGSIACDRRNRTSGSGTGVAGWLTGFADYTFGPFVDVLIQRKIEGLVADVATLREEVQQRLVWLTEAEAENLERRRDRRKRLEEAIHGG